jgi:O-antigen/teichoic acid export membrane protein
MDRDRLYIRAGLSFLLLLIFCVLLILIFYVELPSSAEITSATLLGALVGNLTSTLSYWFDSTEHSENKGQNGSTGDETA